MGTGDDDCEARTRRMLTSRSMKGKQPDLSQSHASRRGPLPRSDKQ